jgi:hypothetical protein
MAVKLAERPKEAKLTVGDALREVKEDCREIRLKLLIMSPALTKENVSQIQREAASIMEKKERKYSYYEIGHNFILQNVVDSVNKKVHLTVEEERLLPLAIGRVYYSPPTGEYLKSAEAAESLEKEGARGKEIFTALKSAYADLNVVAEAARIPDSPTVDMFLNPLRNPYLAFSSFGKIATAKRNIAASVEGDEESQFYA